VLDSSRAPFYRWFPGGIVNTCHNAVDRHVAAGRGAQAAIVWDSPVSGRQRTVSYLELQREVARTAGMLRGLGVAKGDRVLIYMPNVPEAVFAMLACARLGAVHSVVFGGFGARARHAHRRREARGRCRLVRLERIAWSSTSRRRPGARARKARTPTRRHSPASGSTCRARSRA
jgi:acyl-coenzyme A synthetase/AMP-(fatty) acid ligase